MATVTSAVNQMGQSPYLWQYHKHNNTYFHQYYNVSYIILEYSRTHRRFWSRDPGRQLHNRAQVVLLEARSPPPGDKVGLLVRQRIGASFREHLFWLVMSNR